jgi:hypothetical protein
MSLKNDMILIFDYQETYTDVADQTLNEQNEIIDDLLKAGLESDMADNFKDELKYQLNLVKANNEKEINYRAFDYLVETYLRDDIDYLMSSFYDGSVVAHLTLRTWDGEKEIDPMLFDDLNESIKYFRGKFDFNNLKLVRIGDDLILQLIHHDNHHSITFKKDYNKNTFFKKEEQLWNDKINYGKKL